MTAEIPTAVISVAGAVFLSVIGAVLGYYITKKREREAELRKEKLDHYKEFAATLAGIMKGESTSRSQIEFTRACNKLNLIASQSVLDKLRDYRNYAHIKNKNLNLVEHDQKLSFLFYEIRKDLGVSPKDNQMNFHVCLWAAGVSSDNSDFTSDDGA